MIHSAAPTKTRSSIQNHHNGHLNEAASVKLEKARQILEQKGFQISQHNGQRISKLISSPTGAPLGDGGGGDSSSMKQLIVEEKDNEVFIGKLPRNLYEDELLALLEKAGRVYKIRLMMEYSGYNRGFAFATYVTSQEANRACTLLAQSIIRPDCPPIGVLKSFDNKCLFFGNLPVKINKSSLLHESRRHLADVEDVELLKANHGCSSRFANVYFRTHEAATQARRLLLPGDVKLFNRLISVDWVKKDAASSREKLGGPMSHLHQKTQLARSTISESLPHNHHYHHYHHQLNPLGPNQHSETIDSIVPATQHLINFENIDITNNDNHHLPLLLSPLDDHHKHFVNHFSNILDQVPMNSALVSNNPVLGAKAMHMLESSSYGFNII